RLVPGRSFLPHRFHLCVQSILIHVATHNDHISLVIAHPARDRRAESPSHQPSNRMIMAGNSLKRTLFASVLVAIVVAIPMTASAETGIASVYNYNGHRAADGERETPG